MINLEQQQCHLAALGYYKLRRRDGMLAIDGIPGPASRTAVYNFQLQHQVRPDGTELVLDGRFGPATEKALREVIGTGEEPQKIHPPVTKPKGGYRWISPEDFRCRCGGQYCNGWPAEPHEKTLDLLEQLGEIFEKPIQAHSGLRCRSWNRIQGGAGTSKHMYGMAMDFHLEGISPEELYDAADRLLGNSGGLGLYDWGIHLDDRSVPARWDSRGR